MHRVQIKSSMVCRLQNWNEKTSLPCLSSEYVCVTELGIHCFMIKLATQKIKQHCHPSHSFQQCVYICIDTGKKLARTDQDWITYYYWSLTSAAVAIHSINVWLTCYNLITKLLRAWGIYRSNTVMYFRQSIEGSSFEFNKMQLVAQTDQLLGRCICAQVRNSTIPTSTGV